MKKVKNGKVYDTDKAKELGMWIPNPYGNDFNYHQETLYLKRTGEFFIHEERYGNDKIRPLTYEEAQAWVEDHLDGDEYIKYFGEPEEDGSKVALNIYIRADIAQRLKTESARQGKSIGEVIEALMK